MKHRSPAAPLLLPFITFGIYTLVWLVKTKNEMNTLGAQIPTAWWLIVPFGNIWWLWKYSVGVEVVTRQRMNRWLAFLLSFLLGIIGHALVQGAFNDIQPQMAPVAAR